MKTKKKMNLKSVAKKLVKADVSVQKKLSLKNIEKTLAAAKVDVKRQGKLSLKNIKAELEKAKVAVKTPNRSMMKIKAKLAKVTSQKDALRDNELEIQKESYEKLQKKMSSLLTSKAPEDQNKARSLKKKADSLFETIMNLQQEKIAPAPAPAAK